MMYPFYYGYRRYPFYATARRNWTGSAGSVPTSYVDKEDASRNSSCATFCGDSCDNTKSAHDASCEDNEMSRSSSCDGECDDMPVFNFFGFSLYFDDLLLLAIIYFLYSEDVHDPELFIALLLLLLS